MHQTLALFVVVLVAATAAQQPFLYNAPPTKRAEFEQLLAQNAGLPRAEVDKKVIQWVSQQGPAIKLEWADFQMRMREAKIAHEGRLARFSPEARRVDATLTNIADNPRLTPDDKGYLIHRLISSLPPNIREEIVTALEATRPSNF